MKEFYMPKRNYRRILNGTYHISEEYDATGNTCFCGCKTLEYIEIPANIKEIGSNAFFACENLKTVKMTNSVKNIKYYTFALCPALEEIYLSDGLELNGDWFDEVTNPKCRVYHRGHIYIVEDIRLYY